MSGLFIFIFIAAILVSIAIHELGHFASAKKFNIKVHEYFVGFGPRIWSTRKGETEYGIKAWPLGGYVKIAGMNPLEEIAPEDEHRVFKAAKPWQRAIVLAAGSFTHFVIGLLLIAGIFWLSGVAQFEPTTKVDRLTPNSPATEAGIEEGDRILAIGGTPTATWDEAVDVITDNPGEEVTITVERDGGRVTLGPVALAENHPDRTTERRGFLGVGPVVEQVDTIEYSLFAALKEGGKQTAFLARDSLFAFRQIFSPSKIGELFRVATNEEERGLDDPATVIGVGKVAGDFGTARDWVGLIGLIAGFNIFIGVANLLPLPPLDGGHLAVLAYEKVTKRDVDMRKLMPITATVIALFGSLFLLLLFLDIFRPLPSLG